MLDDAGFQDAVIAASNDLDEFLIHDLKMQGAAISSWGVGTNLITSKDCPSFGGVYKLAAIQNADGEFQPKIKISENIEKITNPGIKPFIVFTIKKPVCCALISSALLMRHLIQRKSFFSLTQMLHGRKHFFRVEPTQCVNCLSQSSSMENVSMSPHL